MKATLTYAERIHQKIDFDRILEKRPISNRWVAIHFLLGSANTDRLGIVISKRFIKKSTQRNWIKRKIREAFRNGNKSRTPIDLIVRLRKQIANNEEKSLFALQLQQLLTEVRNREYVTDNPLSNKELPVSDKSVISIDV